MAAERRQQWTDVAESVLWNTIPWNKHNIEVVTDDDTYCSCDADCCCGYSFGNPKANSCLCVCMSVECKWNCDGCKEYKHNNNNQITNQALQHQQPPRFEVEYINKKIGYGLKTKERIYDGKLLGVFCGDIGLENEIKDGPYTIDIGKLSIFIKKKGKNGKIVKGKWRMDCSSRGSILNYCNSTCFNNNAKCIVVHAEGVPYAALYATEDIPAGAWIHWSYGSLYNHPCCCTDINPEYECTGWIGTRQPPGM